MRLFVGVRLSEATTALATSAIERMRDEASRRHLRIGWVPRENLHLTLKFLGSTDDAKLPAIVEALQRVASRHPVLALRVRGASSFPPARAASVLWLGVEDPGSALAAIANDVEREMTSIGFAPEQRPYIPHLTVARLKEPKPVAFLVEPFASSDFGESAISELILFESRTLPSGSVYRERERILLAGRPKNG